MSFGNGEASQGSQKDHGMKGSTKAANTRAAGSWELMGMDWAWHIAITGAGSKAVVSPGLRGVSLKSEGLCGGSFVPPGGED